MIKNFLAQTGDPTNTGSGGRTASGDILPDEVSKRMKFNRRGLVGMWTTGKDKGTSQFFFTLAACPWLDKTHTLFGKVVGQSIYNLLTFNELEINDDQRPERPPVIKSVRLL